MISKHNFEKEYIEQQTKKYPNIDITKLEMTIFAFGLLDELVKCDIPLIFKGGTSLLLLFNKPYRLSTDIDIIIPPDFDFDKTFEKVKSNFPFYEGEERGNISNKHFRHFYFSFYGPISKKECRINLDVSFEKNPYPNTLLKEIKTPFTETIGVKTFVKIPTHESILGDKLTAFAPTTIGVNPFMTSLGKPIDNRLQVIKQFYDIAKLYDYINNIDDVLNSYKTCQDFENEFRNANYTLKDTLLDTFNHAAEIASMGLWNKKSNFYSDVAQPGIQGIASNIFDGKYNQLLASIDASKIMFLAATLLSKIIIRKDSSSSLINKQLKAFKAIPDKDSFVLIKKSLATMNELQLL